MIIPPDSFVLPNCSLMHKPLFLLKSSKTPWNDGEREKGGERVSPNDGLSGNWFPLCLLHLPPIPPSCPSTSAFPPISASLSRSIHGRRVWMWIELQIRSVLIMPLKRGLWEHLSLALSRNGCFPGSWSPPLPHQPPSPQPPAPPDQPVLQSEPPNLKASFRCQRHTFRNQTVDKTSW